MPFIDKITDLIGKLSALVLVSLTLLVVYDALSRYLFHSGSIALQELEWHLFDIIILLGISFALKEGSHVRVDIFYANFSTKTQSIISLVSLIFFIMPFSFLIIYMGYDFVLQSFIQVEGSSDPGGLPFRYLIKSVMILSFIFVIFQALSEVTRLVKVLKS